MTNLLPPQLIQKNTTEYRLRFAGTALSMLAVVFVLATILLVPSYFLTSHKRAAIENDPVWQEDKDGVASLEQQKEFEKIIKETNSVLGVFGNAGEEFKVSNDVIAKIVGYKEAPIVIDGIFYDAAKTGGTLSIKGVASSRQSLISFTDTLKRDPSFASVDLPISNLVKDRNITFTTSIKLKGDIKEEEDTGTKNIPVAEEEL